MNKPVSSYGIHSANIDPLHLFPSLVNESLRIGRLSAKNAESIQQQLMALLSSNILDYTRHESNSVKTETAQSLLRSILYDLDLALSEYPSFESAMDALLSKEIGALYREGLNAYEKRYENSRTLLFAVQRSMIPNPMIAYNDTLQNGFTDFFSASNPRFDAHDSNAVIDYPPLFEPAFQEGIRYIEQYLQRLKLENTFCACFSDTSINRLIKCCGKRFKTAPSDLMVNLSELILKNALCCVLSGFSATKLFLDQSACDRLSNRLNPLSENELKKLLSQCMDELFFQLELTDPELCLYLAPFSEAFLPQLMNAVKQDTLDGCILLSDEHRSEQATFYVPGARLPDKKLRDVVRELGDCETAQRKADLIQDEIGSIEDLVEIFNSSCIFAGEYAVIFQRMSLHELAFLAGEFMAVSPFSEEGTAFLNGFSLLDQKGGLETADWAQDSWQNLLIQYIQTTSRVDISMSKIYNEL